ASDHMAEPNYSSQDRHHPLIAETQSWGVKTVIVAGRSGHLAKGGHIGGGLGVCGFSVAETLVGGLANCPQGIPVLRADTTPDSEIIRIADDRLGAQRPSLFEILLQPGGFVITAQRRVDSLG